MSLTREFADRVRVAAKGALVMAVIGGVGAALTAVMLAAWTLGHRDSEAGPWSATKSLGSDSIM